MPRIDSSLPQVKPSVPPSFREAMRRSPDNTANGLLPIAHALGAGFVTFCGVGLISIGLGWPVKWPLIIAGAVMLIVMCLSGWWMVKNEVLWSVEKIFGDLNKDGVIGQPIQATHFEVRTGPNSIRFGQVNLPPQLVIEWCRAAVSQKSLAYDSWIKKFALPDGTQGRERYAMFRAWLTEQGYAKDLGSNKGFNILWYNDEAVGFVNSFADFEPEDGTPLLEADRRIAAKSRHTHTRTQAQEWEDDES
jgi:hypothetical protein